MTMDMFAKLRLLILRLGLLVPMGLLLAVGTMVVSPPGRRSPSR